MSGNAWSRGDGHSELDLTDSMILDFEKKLGAGKLGICEALIITCWSDNFNV